MSEPSAQRTLPYRKDIDGMRGFSMISILLFHLGVSWMPGGFACVDIFFVISGFLITSILVRALESGHFSLRTFYIRRGLRLAPSVALVIATTLCLGWIFLVPGDLQRLGKSTVAASFFVSNIYFYRNVGYFDAASEYFPLLHTWSLAIEEQFYLLFPLLLLGLWRWGRKRMTGTIAALLMISLVTAFITWQIDPVAAFYLLPSRAWELLLGSLVCLLPARFEHTSISRTASTWLSVVAVSLIAFALFGKNAVDIKKFDMICLAATGGALLLLSGNGDHTVGRFLKSPLLVYAGKISYPFYLWHLVVLVFYRLLFDEEPSIWALGLLITVILALSILTHRLIEQPAIRSYRAEHHGNGLYRKLYLGISLVTCITAALTGLYIHNTAGAPQRLAEDKRAFLEQYQFTYPHLDIWNKYDLKQTYRFDCNFMDIDRYLSTGDSLGVRRTIDLSKCLPSTNSGKPRLLIWGDSHAEHLYKGIERLLSNDYALGIVATSGCAPAIDNQLAPYRCQLSNRTAMQSIQDNPPDVVLLARARGHSIEDTLRVAGFLRAAGVKRIVQVGPVPQYLSSLPSLIVKHYWTKTDIKSTSRHLQPEIWETEKQMKAFASSARNTVGVEYVSMIDPFCDQQKNCTFDLSESGDVRNLATWDYGHFTPESSVFAARKAFTWLLPNEMH